ncbi:hypothetical protein J7K99_01865 [bacterium]|nr:hypothetical protein [bacterium]
MLLRLILFGLALVVFYQVKRGLATGTVHMRGVTVDREDSPAKFYIVIAVYILLGLMLTYFAIFGKMEGG